MKREELIAIVHGMIGGDDAMTQLEVQSQLDRSVEYMDMILSDPEIDSVHWNTLLEVMQILVDMDVKALNVTPENWRAAWEMQSALHMAWFMAAIIKTTEGK